MIGGNNGSGLSLHVGVDAVSSKCGGRRGRAGGAAVSSRSSTDLALPLHAEAEPVELATLSSSSSSVAAAAADRCRSHEPSDGSRARVSVSVLLPGQGAAGWTVERQSTTGQDGRRLPNVGRMRLKKDERMPATPARERVRVAGVDGTPMETDGESSELRASVLFDTLLIDMRLSDELLPTASPREKMDSRFGNVSTGNSIGDISASSTNTLKPQVKMSI